MSLNTRHVVSAIAAAHLNFPAWLRQKQFAPVLLVCCSRSFCSLEKLRSGSEGDSTHVHFRLSQLINGFIRGVDTPCLEVLCFSIGGRSGSEAPIMCSKAAFRGCPNNASSIEVLASPGTTNFKLACSEPAELHQAVGMLAPRGRSQLDRHLRKKSIYWKIWHAEIFQ